MEFSIGGKKVASNRLEMKYVVIRGDQTRCSEYEICVRCVSKVTSTLRWVFGIAGRKKVASNRLKMKYVAVHGN